MTEPQISVTNSDVAVASCNHLLQLYTDEKYFLEVLAEYIADGINKGDNVVIIVTVSHLTSLHRILADRGVNLTSLSLNKRFFALDAQTTLDTFLIDNWPDEELFNKNISGVLYNAGYPERSIRAFGEMVVLLWESGYHAATVQLEELWNKFCNKHPFTLFCAYPADSFKDSLSSSLQHIKCAHGRQVDKKEDFLRAIGATT
jgi:hypothetical protein